MERRDVLEELQRLLRRQREDVGDGLALVVDLERLAVVPLAAAHVASDVDVGKEVHLDLDCAVAGQASQRPPLTLNEKRPGV